MDILKNLGVGVIYGVVGLIAIYNVAFVLAIICIELPITRNQVYKFLNNKFKQFHYEGYSSYYSNYQRRVFCYIKYYFQCPYILCQKALRVNQDREEKSNNTTDNAFPNPINIESPDTLKDSHSENISQENNGE